MSKDITPKPASHFLYNILAVLVRQSHAKKSLQINPTPFQKVIKFLKFPVYLNFILTDKLIPSAKHNSTMQRAMGLISLLLDVTSSQEVPFCQPQLLQSMHHGATYLCILFLSPLLHRYWFAVDASWLQCEHHPNFHLLQMHFSCCCTFIKAE